MFDLSRLNTLAVQSRARELHVVTAEQDLALITDRARRGPIVILGGGSNVVLGEELATPVFVMRNRGIRCEHRRGRAEVTVAAGENWHGLVRWSLGRGLFGLENLALIPGSVGAAPVQNIGAYGTELDARFVWLNALEVGTGRVLRLTREECGFGYRSSIFKSQPGNFVILEVTLTLHASPGPVVDDYPEVGVELARMGRLRPGPIDVAEAVCRIRRRKLPDPRRVPNVGSFFKNPVVDEKTLARLAAAIPDLKVYPAATGRKVAAAQLIDLCRTSPAGVLEGWAVASAPVCVWRRQPLVLTNPGRRPAIEVLGVAEQIRAAVLARFGVRLELEPDTFGC
ncbi:MAG TPA: UDP-N-acetylmuramate dehydrogenase [Pseudomonadales bacterium]